MLLIPHSGPFGAHSSNIELYLLQSWGQSRLPSHGEVHSVSRPSIPDCSGYQTAAMLAVPEADSFGQLWWCYVISTTIHYHQPQWSRIVWEVSTTYYSVSWMSFLRKVLPVIESQLDFKILVVNLTLWVLILPSFQNNCFSNSIHFAGLEFDHKAPDKRLYFL